MRNVTGVSCVSCGLQTVSSVEWHRKGDYLSTVMPADILFNFFFEVLPFFFDLDIIDFELCVRISNLW